MASPTIAELEQAAQCILQIIRDTPGLESTRIAIIGDLAFCKYLPRYGSATSIEFILSKSSPPASVRKKVLGHPMSPLVERGQNIYFTHPRAGWELKVLLTAEWLCPYLPSAARPLNTIAIKDRQSLPYISLEDLIVFKAEACGLHDSAASNERRACECAGLLELATEHAPLDLEGVKMQKLEEALEHLVDWSPSECDKNWWQRRIRGRCEKRRSLHEILTELAETPRPKTAGGSDAQEENWWQRRLSASSSSATSINTTPRKGSVSSLAATPLRSPTSPTPSMNSSIYSTLSRTSSSGTFSSVRSSSSSICSTSIKEERTEKSSRPQHKDVSKRGTMTKRHSKTFSGSLTAPNSMADDVTRRLRQLDIERSASPGIALSN